MNMKRIICICVTFIILSLTGCSTKVIYELREPQENIKSIEIGMSISQGNLRSFETRKELSKQEISDFLNCFANIEFGRYYLGDPMSVGGLTVRITYNDESCEKICYHWSQYEKDGDIYDIWRYCEKEDFENLISKFYDIESDDES